MKKSRLWHKKKRKKSYFIFNQIDINKVMFHQDLLVVVKDFVPLIKRKENYVGRCPFCKPITTNNSHFILNDKKRLYKCFECGRSGSTASSFLMQYFNASFDEVLKFLNKKYGPNIDLFPERTRVLKNRSGIDDDLPF